MVERPVLIGWWRFGITIGHVWFGIPHYVTDGRGFNLRWRPFGRWAVEPGVGTSPFPWMVAE